MEIEEIKRQLGTHAVDALVKSGMKLGLGTGSTAIHAVKRVGELLKAGSLEDIVAVPTSFQTVVACQQAGIALATLNDPAAELFGDPGGRYPRGLDPRRHLTELDELALVHEHAVGIERRRELGVRLL